MRTTLDRLISWTGLILAAVLLVAGGLMTYASNFVSKNVSEQLSQQQITMPAAAALTTPEMKANLAQYSGQPMTTGAQAKAYADHYILVHMNEASGGKTYAQVSAEAGKLAKDPGADQAKVTELQDLKQTLFMGSTLRGLLLNAYAFGTMGTIAGIAAIGAFIGSALFLLLGFLGLRHAKQVSNATPTIRRTERVNA